MKSQRSITRKTAKRKAQRKDFMKRKHINANVPTIVKEEKVERFRQLKDRDGKVRMQNGRPLLEHIGYKTVKVKKPVYRHKKDGNPHKPAVDAEKREVGMIQYPRSRKEDQNPRYIKNNSKKK